MTNREVSAIVQGVNPPVIQTTTYGVATSIRALHEVHAVLHKEIFTGAMRSAVGVLKDRLVVNWRDDDLDDRWDFSVRR